MAERWPDRSRRLLLLKWAIGAALLSEMALCPKLWGLPRSFPTIPAFRWLPDLPPPATISLSLLFAASVVFVAVRNRPGPAAYLALFLGIVLALFDINRMQPWFYQVLLLLLCLGNMRWDQPDSKLSRGAIASCGIVLSGTYFWSGMQKANLTFSQKVFPWLLQPFGLESLRPLWFLAPLLEAGIGILLLFPRTRTAGIVAAIVMHGLLLISLGPFGQNVNSVVWPWNVWMPVLTFLVFFRNSEPILPRAGESPVGVAVTLLAGVLPAFSLCDKWDDNLSAALYSGRTRQAFILFSEPAVQRLPLEVRPYLERRPDRIGLDLTRWALTDLNVPPYPETRVYQAVVRSLQKQNLPVEGTTLVVTDRPPFNRANAKFKVLRSPDP